MACNLCEHGGPGVVDKSMTGSSSQLPACSLAIPDPERRPSAASPSHKPHISTDFPDLDMKQASHPGTSAVPAEKEALALPQSYTTPVNPRSADGMKRMHGGTSLPIRLRCT